MFGRKLRLTFFRTNVAVRTDTIVFDVDTLHGKRGLVIRGAVQMEGFSQVPTCELDIYNLSTSDILQLTNLAYNEVNGKRYYSPIGMQIEAGYADGDFGVIFRGKVLRPTSQRPEPQTSSLHIVATECAEALSVEALSARNFIGGVNWYSVANGLIKEGLLNLPEYQSNFVVQISKDLQKRQVDGQFCFDGGTLYQAVQKIAMENDMAFALNHNGVMLGTYGDLLQRNSKPPIVLTPTTGLVGIPSLSTDGVTCNSLLNPNIDIFTPIQLNNEEITNDITEPFANVNGVLGVGLSTDGIYFVVQYTHNFDTSVGAFQTTMRCLSGTLVSEQLGG